MVLGGAILGLSPQSILPFNDFLLVGFASGAITAYTADGDRQYCFASDYLSTMEGESKEPSKQDRKNSSLSSFFCFALLLVLLSSTKIAFLVSYQCFAHQGLFHLEGPFWCMEAVAPASGSLKFLSLRVSESPRHEKRT